jgi:hypothetical protein
METNIERVQKMTDELFDGPIRADKKIIMDNKTEEFYQKLAEVPVGDLYEMARQKLSDVCQNPRKFTMTIPPRIDDTDMLFGECINRMKVYFEKLQVTEEALEKYKADLKALRDAEEQRKAILRSHYSKNSKQ